MSTHEANGGGHTNNAEASLSCQDARLKSTPKECSMWVQSEGSSRCISKYELCFFGSRCSISTCTRTTLKRSSLRSSSSSVLSKTRAVLARNDPMPDSQLSSSLSHAWQASTAQLAPNSNPTFSARVAGGAGKRSEAPIRSPAAAWLSNRPWISRRRTSPETTQ